MNGGKGKMVGDIMEAEYYGIAAKKGNKALVKQVNEALAALKRTENTIKSTRSGSELNLIPL